MSRLRLGKRLQPAKKAWKSFSNTLQSKVQNLNIPKEIKATFKRLFTTFHSLHHHLIPSRGRRRRPLTTGTPCAAASNYHVHRHSKNNTSAIRIDDLFAGHAAASSMHVHANNKAHAQGETSRDKEVVEKEDLQGGNSCIDTIDDAWKIVVAKTPRLQVDERGKRSSSPSFRN